MKKLVVFVAIGFGLGLSPVASGTVGSFPGVLIAYAMSFQCLPIQIALAIALALLAIPVCSVAEAHYGTKDDGRIVADEFMTFPLCLLGIPWVQHLWILPIAFAVNRVLDIIKPTPARQAQNIKGGAGIVLDDVVSSLYALLVNHAIYWFIQSRFF